MYHAACKVEFQPFTVVLTADVFQLVKYARYTYVYHVVRTWYQVFLFVFRGWRACFLFSAFEKVSVRPYRYGDTQARKSSPQFAIYLVPDIYIYNVYVVPRSLRLSNPQL